MKCLLCMHCCAGDFTPPQGTGGGAGQACGNRGASDSCTRGHCYRIEPAAGSHSGTRRLTAGTPNSCAGAMCCIATDHVDYCVIRLVAPTTSATTAVISGRTRNTAHRFPTTAKLFFLLRFLLLNFDCKPSGFHYPIPCQSLFALVR